MTLNIADSLHRYADKSGIIKGKVVQQPDAKSQQEGDDENLCISPSDVQFPEYVSEYLQHFLEKKIQSRKRSGKIRTTAAEPPNNRGQDTACQHGASRRRPP